MSMIERSRSRPGCSLGVLAGDGGEVGVATVMFADISGFTAIAETMAPATLAVWLGRFLDAIAEPVLRHGGRIEQVLGDGVLATFAPAGGRVTPGAMTRHARAAAACALEVAEAVAALNRRLRADGWPTAGLRIGLHVGPVATARLGAGRQGLSTITGDAVNTAARLQQRCRLEGAEVAIVVSDAFRLAIGEGWATQRLGAMALKGKRAPVTAWRLHGRKAAPVLALAA
jgi:adenylate cyclase